MGFNSGFKGLIGWQGVLSGIKRHFVYVSSHNMMQYRERKCLCSYSTGIAIYAFMLHCHIIGSDAVFYPFGAYGFCELCMNRGLLSRCNCQN